MPSVRDRVEKRQRARGGRWLRERKDPGVEIAAGVGEQTSFVEFGQDFNRLATARTGWFEPWLKVTGGKRGALSDGGEPSRCKSVDRNDSAFNPGCRVHERPLRTG